MSGSDPAVSFEGTRRHHYFADLGTDEFLRIAIEQRGVDLAVTVRDPSGDFHSRVDSPTGARGEEVVEIWSREPGRYHFEVATSSERSEGTYAVRVTAPRPATEDQRARAEWAWIFARAEELRRAGDDASVRAAIETYRRSLEVAERLEARYPEARTLRALGRAHNRLGERGQAQRVYAQVLKVLDSTPEDPHQLRIATLNSLGRIHRLDGRHDAAQTAYEEAWELAVRGHHRVRQAQTLHNLARLSSARGNMLDAISWYDQALEILQRLGQREKQIRTRTSLGGLYAALGELDSALDHLDGARGLLLPGDRRLRADVLEQTADLLVLQGRPEEAFAEYRRALRLYRELGDQDRQAYTLDGMGRTLILRGRHRGARDHLEEALRLFDTLGDARGRAIVLQDLGWLCTEKGEPDCALRHLEASLDGMRAIGYRAGAAHTLFRLAIAERLRGDPWTAWLRSEEALLLVEDLRRKAGRSDLQATFFASRQDYFDLAVDLLMELAQGEPAIYLPLAFEVGERSRARNLLDSLPNDGTPRRMSPDLLALEERLRQEINALERRRMTLLERAAPRSAVETAERRLRDLLARHRENRARARAASSLHAPKPLTTREVQALLDPDSVLLQFDLGPERSYLWLVTRARLRVFPLPGRLEIDRLARRTHELLAGSHQRLSHGPLTQAMSALSTHLLEPVKAHLGDERLLIAADGALHYIPFAALPDPASEGREPLIARHEIVHLPSISVLAWLRDRGRKRPAGPGGLAVLGDPVFSVLDPRVATGLSRPDPADGLSDRFRRLPSSRSEARSILDLWPRQSGPGRLAVDFEASKQLVLGGELAEARLLHFATHGVIDDRFPELSGLVLSLADPAGAPIDGFLRVHEIHALELSADLVFLSACQTALGSQVRGEGMVGLTHAFLSAGAQTVGVTLWDVRDNHTTTLVQRFYRALLDRKLPPPAALREAQLSMRRDARYGAPFYWAGVILQGDWQ